MTEMSAAEVQQLERDRTLAQLRRDLARAAERQEPWYTWLLDRARGLHRHDLRRDDGTPIACPVAGCREVHL